MKKWIIGLCAVLIVLMPANLSAKGKSKAKAPKTIRVACVGNSVTYGYGLKDREHTAYPVRLQEMLGDGFQVGNFGHSGATLLYKGHRPYIHTEEFRQALDFKADWVVIHLGLNDTDPRNWPDWKEEFIPNYRALIDSFLTVNPKARVLICQMTPIFDRHHRFQSGTRDWHAQVQQAIRTVAQGAKVQMIDLFTPLHSRPELFPDALHPNAEGAKILAQTVFSALTGDYGGLRLPPLLTDGVVLQRDEPLRLHGMSNARQTIVAELLKDGRPVEGAKASAIAGFDGKWQLEMPAMQAGGPYTLTVTASPSPISSKKYAEVIYPLYSKPYWYGFTHKWPARKIEVRDVWIGDVWLASGQSNMELRVDQVLSNQQDVADAKRLTNLHLYNMPARARTDAVEWPDSVLTFTNELRHMDMQGWQTASAESVQRFSAIAYNFGRVLADSLRDVPIGIICNAVGGSTTESWIDRTTLEYEYPAILRDWLNNDHTQAWARGRARQNIARALNKDLPLFNTLQRHPYEPCYLFEAAIMPLEQFAVKGVLWYQGESNAHNVELHERLFRLLEQSWRKEWKRPDLPFYFVQLSSLNRPSWPAFRDSQRRLAQSLPNTWMTVSSDVGDQTDVHYKNKRPVGERLAAQALAHTYGRSVESEGPKPERVTTVPPEMIITFSHADGLSVTQGFEIAGADGIYHPATTQVQGNTIRLTSPHVQEPVSVRYGWQPFTRGDLRNAHGFPASTFALP